MHRLCLLRHAKSASTMPGKSDFERPLSEEGRFECAVLGPKMRQAGLIPAIVHCSSARRTRETWEGIAPHIGTRLPAPDFTRDLYDGDEEQALMLIRDTAEEGPVLLIGHNPTMEVLARTLVKDGDPRALRALRRGFRECSLAVIELDVPYSAAGAGKGRLVDFIVPTA